MRKLIVFSSILALTLLATPPAHAAVIYRNGEGFHSEEEDSGPMQKSASEQYHKAQALEAEGRLTKALGAYKTLLSGFPLSGAAAEAQFKIAELQEKVNEPERAFHSYGKYITNYPNGSQFDTVVERQFGIARAFLNGERRKLFGMKTFSSMERAQKMFEEIVKSAPYSKEAPRAQFSIGMALEKQGEYADALAAYQLTVDKYPNDSVAGDAQYQIGYVQMHLIQEGSNDQAARIKARDAFEDFTIRYPQSEKIPQARENIARLTSTNLKKTLDVARFYKKTGNYKAAAIYYKEVLQSTTNGPEAAEARRALEHMKQNIGEDAMRSGPENAETGNTALAARKMQAQVDTASRPDYAGPPAPASPAPKQ